ncbi:MAG: YybH family protein [Gemmataceae bacterium]
MILEVDAGEATNMNFQETLAKHLTAIQERNLAALMETLPDDDAVTLITADGRLVKTAREFAEMHRDWFGQTTWTLNTQLVSTWETTDLAVVVLRLDYRDNPPDQPPIQAESYLTLAFARQADERWVMVLDQNTPMTRAAK